MAGSDAERATFLRAGMEKSIATVQSFGSLDANADLSFEPTAEEVALYIDGVIQAYDVANSGSPGDDHDSEQGSRALKFVQ